MAVKISAQTTRFRMHMTPRKSMHKWIKEEETAYEQDHIYLDEIMKTLFTVSKPVLVKMMNNLFEEHFAPEDTDVTFENSEFVRDHYDKIHGDLFLGFSNVGNQQRTHFHLEFQTKNDGSMVLRMFDYGFQKAKELARYRDADEQVIRFPKQLVLFLEKNENIHDILKMRLIMPDGQSLSYQIPTLKVWRLTETEVICRGLYPLLPLQVLRLRQVMEYAYSRKNNKDRLNELILEAKEVAIQTAVNAEKLLHQGEIGYEDYDKILVANQNLFAFLNRKYVGNAKLEEEVNHMTKTVIDPEVFDKGIEKGIEIGKEKDAIKMFQKGMSVADIKEITELPDEIIQRLKRDAEQHL